MVPYHRCQTKNLLVSQMLLNWIVLFIILVESGAIRVERRLIDDVIPVISVQENQGKNILDGYPIDVVVPLPEGRVQDASNIKMVVLDGNDPTTTTTVPIQVVDLESWPSDGSLRHVMVHFQVSLPPFSQQQFSIDLGNSLGAPPSPPVISPVSVTQDTMEAIHVENGKIRFIVSKTSFNLIDQLWVDKNGDGIFAANEQVVLSNNQNGGHLVPRSGGGNIQYDADRLPDNVQVEESGPLRVVIRVEAYTKFTSTTDHLHGFAVRIYAYANQPFVKVDYQLQNSDKSIQRSWPLYFDALNIDLRLSSSVSSSSSSSIGNDAIVSFGAIDGTVFEGQSAPASIHQEHHNRYRIQSESLGTQVVEDLEYSDIKQGTAFMHISDSTNDVHVTAVGRNFWQAWPNGLAFDNGMMTLELFPSWSAQWEQATALDSGEEVAGRTSPTGLYWLKDMQHVYKEMLLVFHPESPSTSDLQTMSSIFQFPPVGSVSYEWHASARAMLPMSGLIPSIPNPNVGSDSFTSDEIFSYYGSVGTVKLDPNNELYRANVRNFGDDEGPGRARPCTTGGWPYSLAKFVVSGQSEDYFFTETVGAIGELNVRPQWMAGYSYDGDQGSLELTENPYCGGTWRVFDGHGISVYATELLEGTDGVSVDFGARDDQHGWFYHVFEAYYITGNRWILDWFRFINQFRQIRLNRGDPFDDMSARAVGHSLAHAIYAGRISRDEDHTSRALSFLRLHLRPDQHPVYGVRSLEEPIGGFQTGYEMRSIIAFLDEVRGRDDQAYAEGFQYLSGLMEWNIRYGNFCYYLRPLEEGNNGVSDGTGLAVVDPQAWYFHRTGKIEYWDHIELYMSEGINGGRNPYGHGFNDAGWLGQYEGAVYHFVSQNLRSDLTPPDPILDLSAAIAANDEIFLQWTTPEDTSRFHLVWSTKPIVELHSTDASVVNWWAAQTVGVSLVALPLTKQSMVFSIGTSPSSLSSLFFALFTFDDDDNMSGMSNVAETENGAPLLQIVPTPSPTVMPKPQPTQEPSPGPTLAPTPSPTPAPTPRPTPSPTLVPTPFPAPQPTRPPTSVPTPPPTPEPFSTLDMIHIYAGDSFEMAAEALVPGQTLIVHQGDYTDNAKINLSVAGTQDAPIVIQGAIGEARPRIYRQSNSNSQNTINLEGDASFITIRGLEIMSNGGDGVKIFANGNTRSIVLEDLKIHGIHVGIRVLSSVEDLTIRECEIYDTATDGSTGVASDSSSGNGIVLGCSDGSCDVSQSVVENNWIHDIKGGFDGTGIVVYPGCSGMMIRDNVMVGVKSGFRVFGNGGFPAVVNIMERNVVWGCDFTAIGVISDAIVRNNVVIDAEVGVGATEVGGEVPRSLFVVQNTITDVDTALVLDNSNSPDTIMVSFNAMYCSDFGSKISLSDVTKSKFEGNVIHPFDDAVLPESGFGPGNGKYVDFVDPDSNNFYPSSSGALVPVMHWFEYVDFDGRQRRSGGGGGPTAGAYEYEEGGGQLWMITNSFKPVI